MEVPQFGVMTPILEFSTLRVCELSIHVQKTLKIICELAFPVTGYDILSKPMKITWILWDMDITWYNYPQIGVKMSPKSQISHTDSQGRYLEDHPT